MANVKAVQFNEVDTVYYFQRESDTRMFYCKEKKINEKMRIKNDDVADLCEITTDIADKKNQMDNGKLSDEIDYESILSETNENGDTILHIAILNGNHSFAIGMIDLLPRNSKCMNIQNNLFQTPLHLAVLTRQRLILLNLILKGCDLNIRDRQGNTAFHIACIHENVRMVKDITLVLGDQSNKELFTAKNYEGLSCLHSILRHRNFKILKYLSAEGININMRDLKSGRTILHYAVEDNDSELVKVLLSHPDIDLKCETYSGETPYHLALSRNFRHIIKILKAKGEW